MRAEVRLRVPNMKERAKDSGGYPLDHADLRFRKIIELPGRPKVGDELSLSTQAGLLLPATVMRVDLDEPRELFVLSCRYGRRIITAEEYAALNDDPEWRLKHLLED